MVGEGVAAALEADLVVEGLVVGFLEDVGLEGVTLQGVALEVGLVPLKEGYRSFRVSSHFSPS